MAQNYHVPLGQMIAEMRVGTSVAAQIAKFHPTGSDRGMIVRGYFRKPISWRRYKRLVASGGRWWRRHYVPGGAIHDPIMMGPYEGWN